CGVARDAGVQRWLRALGPGHRERAEREAPALAIGRVGRPRPCRAVAVEPHRDPAARLERHRVLHRVVRPDRPDLVRRRLELDEAPGASELRRGCGCFVRRRFASAAGRGQERACGESERRRAVQPGDVSHRDASSHRIACSLVAKKRNSEPRSASAANCWKARECETRSGTTAAMRIPYLVRHCTRAPATPVLRSKKAAGMEFRSRSSESAPLSMQSVTIAMGSNSPSACGGYSKMPLMLA